MVLEIAAALQGVDGAPRLAACYSSPDRRAPPSHVGASAVYRVPWHILNDLEPVAMLSTSTLIIAARASVQSQLHFADKLAPLRELGAHERIELGG